VFIIVVKVPWNLLKSRSRRNESASWVGMPTLTVSCLTDPEKEPPWKVVFSVPTGKETTNVATCCTPLP
jgi:hypothetical protein